MGWESTAKSVIWITYGFLKKCRFISVPADAGAVPAEEVTQKESSSPFLFFSAIISSVKVGDNFFQAFVILLKHVQTACCAANNPDVTRCLTPYGDRDLCRAHFHACVELPDFTERCKDAELAAQRPAAKTTTKTSHVTSKTQGFLCTLLAKAEPLWKN